MKLLLAGSLAIALTLAASPAPSQAQTAYTITDLGVLSGDDTSTASGLNNAGQATGTSSVQINGYSGVGWLYSGGKLTSIAPLTPGDETFGNAINASGEVAGYDYSTTLFLSRAVVYSGGKLTDITSTTLFPYGTLALGINASGEVVGYGEPTTATDQGFLYSAGKMTRIPTLGGNFAIALAINDSGEAVGNSTTATGATHAFSYTNGKITDLGTPSSATAATAIAINKNGEILGELVVGGVTHIATYSNGVWTDLGLGLAGTGGDQPAAINSSGQIVGVGVIPGIYSPKSKRKPAIPVGFIYTSGEFVNLNTLVPSNSGFTVNGCVSINDSGQILCNATTTADYTHTVLLSPK